VKRYQRPLTLGMRLAAWATVAHAGCELVVLSVMVRQSLPGFALLEVMAVEMIATVALGLLMFRGLVVGYFVMGVYGIVRLFIGALAAYAIVSGEVERVDPLLVLGMLIAVPFAIGWIIGAIAVWRAGRRSAREVRSVVGDV
jgi:hypothetical protein